jgi:two-component sensor histidine kinase
MATVTFTVGAYNLYLFARRRPRHAEDFSFGLACLTMGVYDLMAAGAYDAKSVTEGFPWQRSQVATLSLIGAAYCWFVTDYTAARSKAVRNFCLVFFCLSALAVQFLSVPFFWRPDQPAVKHASLPFGLRLAYHEVTPGPFTEFLGLMGFLIFLYVYALALRPFPDQGRRRLPLLVTTSIFCLGLVNDALVHMRILHSPYVIEYAYMGIVLLMAHTLSDAVVESADLKEAIEASELKYRRLVDESLTGIFIASGGVVTFCNRRFAALFGYGDPSEVCGRPLSQLMPLPGKGVRRDGTAVVLETYASDLPVGGMPTVQGMVLDVTERVAAAEQIRQDLREKEVLLREIHHRVKNNLQIITSLLNLESGRIGDETVHRVFEECNRRIRTMSLIHEKLYHSENFEAIDFKEYTEIVVGELIASYGIGKLIRIELDIASERLSLETAIPCGLLLNELVTNAFKHAFPDGRKGTLRVSFAADGAGRRLAVEDDGVGLPAGADPAAVETLGLKLVDVLARQLGGRVEFRSGKGTRVSVIF